jgi:hypothetical protein
MTRFIIYPGVEKKECSVCGVYCLPYTHKKFRPICESCCKKLNINPIPLELNFTPSKKTGKLKNVVKPINEEDLNKVLGVLRDRSLSASSIMEILNFKRNYLTTLITELLVEELIVSYHPSQTFNHYTIKENYAIILTSNNKISGSLNYKIKFLLNCGVCDLRQLSDILAVDVDTIVFHLETFKQRKSTYY